VADPVTGQDTSLDDPSILDEAVEQVSEWVQGGSSRWS